MKLAAAATCASILIALSATCVAAKPTTVTAEVNLRKSPNTDSEVVTVLHKGTPVEVVTCMAGWCQVNFNGQNGYAIAKNLGLAGPHYAVVDGEVEYGPPMYAPGPYVVGPPVYYGGPYWGWGGGWGHRRW